MSVIEPLPLPDEPSPAASSSLPALVTAKNKSTKHRAAQWSRLAIICVTFFVDIGNLGMCTIALPTIKNELGFDESSLQWYGGFLMVGGRLGDILGQEIVLKVSMVAFTVFTLVCALVSSDIGFLVSRALQGMAAAFTIPSAQAMIGHVFPDPKEHALALSWWGATGSMGFVLGPIVGGLFTSLLTWRWIFWFTIILEGSLAVLAMILFHNVEAPHQKRSLRLDHVLAQSDPIGTGLSTPGLILLVYALTAGNQVGWSNASVISTLALAVVLLLAFVIVEKKIARYPFVPPHLWKTGSLGVGCALTAITYAVWQGANYFLTIQLQDLGFTPLETALRFLPLGITAFLVNMIIPHLLAPVGPRNLLLASWLFAIAGITLLTFVHSKADYWHLCVPGMVLYILGVGTVYYVSMVIVVTSAPPEDQGSVAGVFNMSLNIGGAVLGMAILTVVANSVTNSHGGQSFIGARLRGYQASYYGAIAWSVLATLISAYLVFKQHRKAEKNKTAQVNIALDRATPNLVATASGERENTKARNARAAVE
ncbi:aminotriazole resistance protein [Coniella lustricola]|uniref:Aminotriazole resistance protein n=1 Tax=Coniella lustricola TaxID=2025994 RepID=A0A2T3A1V9_9PEZI|nr:aminotriazole resistance protein [Coniella lustricola]